jgi:hypothetical protein
VVNTVVHEDNLQGSKVEIISDPFLAPPFLRNWQRKNNLKNEKGKIKVMKMKYRSWGICRASNVIWSFHKFRIPFM